jgi:hypothetical protein
MRKLFLNAPNSRRDETRFRSYRDFKINGSSLIGTVLAGRSKILKTIHRGLQSSRGFESRGYFFHKLESASQPGSRVSRALPGSALSTQEDSLSLPGTSDVMEGFDRDTWRLTAGVLAALVFAGFLLAVLIPDHYPNAVDSAEVIQARGNLLQNANISTLPKQVGASGKSYTGEATAGPGGRSDQAFSEVSWRENRATQMEAPLTPTSDLALTPELNQIRNQITADSNIARARSSRPVRSKFVDVKMRLIALWHQSLVRSERFRTWARFSHLNKGERKKVGYIVGAYRW